MSILFYHPSKKDAEDYDILLKDYDVSVAIGKLTELNKNFSEYSNKNIIFLTALDQSEKNVLEISYFIENNPNIFIVIVEKHPDPDFLIKLMRLGINEIITKFNIKNCLDTIHRIEEKSSSQVRASNSNQVLVFMSAKGGDGSTTTAAFLAKSLAKTKYKVLLIDLALPFGDLDLFVFKGKIQFDITDLLSSIDRLDESLIKSMANEISENFHFLPSADSFDKAMNISADNLNALINLLKNIYDFILIDTGSSVNPIMSEVLKISDQIYITNKVDLLSMRKTNLILEFCEALNIEQKNISIVLNHVNTKNIISIKDVEKALKKKVSYTIPNESQLSNFLINNNTLFSEPLTPAFTSIFDKWAKTLDFLGLASKSDKIQKNKKSIWGRFK
ncbi:MAG: Cell division inhibitor MinD [Bacteroidota bacterium]|jgi:pilus assembly protein CpaE